MDNTIFQTPWIKVKETAHGFQFAERKGVNSVAVFLIRDTAQGYEVLIRQQPLCLHNPEVGEPQKLFPCPVTRAIEEGETPEQCAAREAYEETGYPVSVSPLGSYIVGTQTNEVVFLFWANVTGLEPAVEQGDGSYVESVSHNEWHPLYYLRECEYAACAIGYLRLMDLLCH